MWGLWVYRHISHRQKQFLESQQHSAAPTSMLRQTQPPVPPEMLKDSVWSSPPKIKSNLIHFTKARINKEKHHRIIIQSFKDPPTGWTFMIIIIIINKKKHRHIHQINLKNITGQRTLSQSLLTCAIRRLQRTCTGTQRPTSYSNVAMPSYPTKKPSSTTQISICKALDFAP